MTRLLTPRRRLRAGRRYRAGFTLVEMLVVIVIIGILAAILLPVLGRAKEGAYQANCASNMKTLYFAISQYKQDTKRYPSSLAFLLPKIAKLDNTAATVGTPSADPSCNNTAVPGVDTCDNTGGGGYLQQSLPFLCPNDSNDDAGVPRSSYGSVTTGFPAARPAPTATNMNLYVWNYWGYDHQGSAYSTPKEAADDLQKDSGGLGKYLTVVPAATTTAAQATAWATETGDPVIGNFRTNPVANSMSNRNTVGTTILTHCVYHRQPTSKLSGPELLYANAAGDTPDANATDPTDGAASALDIVLRADGSAVKPQVGAWLAPRDGTSNWQKQLFQVQ